MVPGEPCRAARVRRGKLLMAVTAAAVLAAAAVGAYQAGRGFTERSGFALRLADGPTAVRTLPAHDVPRVPTRGGARGGFRYAATASAVRGSGGWLHRYRVAVELGIGVDVEQFATEVDMILGDPRGWIAGGNVRLQRVPAGARAEFTVYLASATTSKRMCRAGGFNTKGYTSCRVSGKVVLNVDRWNTAVPGYGHRWRSTAGTPSTTRSVTSWGTATSGVQGEAVRHR
jgi:Protein of unknown function (DUF3152)